jgi:hypothetical protein
VYALDTSLDIGSGGCYIGEHGGFTRLRKMRRVNS